MENPTTPSDVAAALVDKLFAAPGDFTITLKKSNDDIQIVAGNPISRKPFLSLVEVAEVFGISTVTVRRRYLSTGKLKRTKDGFRREDIQRIREGGS